MRVLAVITALLSGCSLFLPALDVDEGLGGEEGEGDVGEGEGDVGKGEGEGDVGEGEGEGDVGEGEGEGEGDVGEGEGEGDVGEGEGEGEGGCTGLRWELEALSRGPSTSENGGAAPMTVTLTGRAVAGQMTIEVTSLDSTEGVVVMSPAPFVGDADATVGFLVVGQQDKVLDGVFDEQRGLFATAYPVRITVITADDPCVASLEPFTIAMNNASAEGTILATPDAVPGDVGAVRADQRCNAAGGSLDPDAFRAVLGVPGGRDPANPGTWVLAPLTAYFLPNGTYATTTDALGRFGDAWDAPASSSSVWTGLASTGDLAAQTCNGFTSALATVSGQAGSAMGVGTAAYSGEFFVCSSEQALLCVGPPPALVRP